MGKTVQYSFNEVNVYLDVCFLIQAWFYWIDCVFEIIAMLKYEAADDQMLSIWSASQIKILLHFPAFIIPEFSARPPTPWLKNATPKP